VRVLRLLITERLEDRELLETLGKFFVVTEGDFEREEVLARVQDADALWVKLRHRIDREWMESAPALKWIATPTTGLNHIDVEEAHRRGIEIVSLRDEVEFLRNIRATAELTVALTLALLRKLPEAVSHVRSAKWDRDLFRGTELYGKTCGIVGMGRLGSIVARYMQGLGMTVIACDPHPLEPPANVALVSLREVAERSDVISVHASYEPATHGLLNREFFDHVKNRRGAGEYCTRRNRR
jgi:D-3-phosphoglycerate dehydrogenase